MCFPPLSLSLSEWQCSHKTAFLHFVRYGEFMEMSSGSGSGSGSLLFTPMHQGRMGCSHAAMRPLWCLVPLRHQITQLSSITIICRPHFKYNSNFSNKFNFYCSVCICALSKKNPQCFKMSSCKIFVAIISGNKKASLLSAK